MITIELKSQTTDEQTLTPEESRLLDSCMDLGQTFWEAFRKTARAAILLIMLPSDVVRNEANRLFQLGFCSRMLACPPRGPEMLDSVLGPLQCEKTWQEFLQAANGKVVLDSEAYPATGKSSLQIARFFFTQGFIAGNVAARECMKGH